MKSQSFVLLISFLMVACSKIKNFEERTNSMEKTTSQMSTMTEELKATATTVYQQQRSLEAETIREKKFEELLDENNDMGTRLVAASAYFKSFEFQLLTTEELKKQRSGLYLEATTEFTRRLSDLYRNVNVKKMGPTKIDHTNQAEGAFYALAAMMDQNHHFQESLADKNKGAPISFYDLVTTAFENEKNGKRLAPHEEVLVAGINKEMIIELMKARVDILSALALSNLTDKRNMTLNQKTKAMIFNITAGRLGSINLPVTIHESNQATKNQVEKYLNAAVKTRTFLVQSGERKQLEKTLRSAYSQISLKEQQQKSTHVDQQLKRIETLIERLQN